MSVSCISGEKVLSARPSWHNYFMFIAKVVSTRSTCNSRPTGAVIVKDNRILATGYNGSMPKRPHCIDKGPDFCFRRRSGIDESAKFGYCRSIHAEANAIIQASRLGISVDGSSIYCTLQPCYSCLKLIVNSGIRKVFYELDYQSEDKERDLMWDQEVGNLIRENQITMAKIQVPDRVIEFMFERVKGITSRRRL